MKEYDEKEIKELIKNGSIEIFDALQYKNIDEYQSIIEKECQKCKIDYFNLAYQVLEKNLSRAYNISDILVSLAPYSKINIDNILKFYELSYSIENGAFKYFIITKSLVCNNHIFAKELLKKLLAINSNFITSPVSAILIELHNSNNESQYETIISYLESSNVIQLKCAISYIYYFDFSNEEFNKVLELFKEKVKFSNEEIDKYLIYGSYDLIEKGYKDFSEILILYHYYNYII